MKMRKTFVSVVTVILVLGLSISTHADLVNLGGGMIYSTDLNLTWLQDANYAHTSGYSTDGLMTWDQANTWATNLAYNGLTGWRLPTYDPDPSETQCASPSTISEMRYLNETELGNICDSTHDNFVPFINVPTTGPHYWSGTTSTLGAYYYWFECG
jgi:hypothetical protein